MYLLKLTSTLDNKPVYISVEHVGHFYRVEAKIEYGHITEPAHTRIGVTTHNNGGFKVKETCDEIIEQLNSLSVLGQPN